MPYVAINVEGGLFPTELLDDIASGEASLPTTSALGGDTRRLTDDVQSAFSAARSYWDAFQHRLDHSNESRTTLTRQDWMLKFLELIGFGSLSFQRASLEAGSQQYNISHLAGEYEDAPPVHIVGIDQELDWREETGRRISPHSLVQEYLNRSNALWGLVGNGSVLRLLRDTARLSKPTYLEFNLQAMMEGNQYSEFALLYRLIHSSHFPHPEGSAQECGLEKFYQDGLDQGGRVRENLRDGVKDALETLGTAFLQHPDNDLLRQEFESGDLDASGYYRQLLRLVYRFLFLMVAEERHLIFPEDSSATAEQTIYRDYYSISNLRDKAERYFRGDRHSDLWLGLGETFRLFRDTESASAFMLSALNGELFGPKGCPDLEEANCRNEDLLYATLKLSTFYDERARLRRRVNYAGLDVEELGSIYESLLDSYPQLSLEDQTFNLATGSERKETGSYYTPPELVRELINSALVPVIEDRLATAEDKEAALLEITVCDPSSGSGHFLLAAARRIARELALVRSGEQEPSPSEYRVALRDVIRSCIYAVDKNPLAVDLCKVAMWIEGHNAGLPLSFIDNHIKCGDSLVGVLDMVLLNEGIPDTAYKFIEGDDKAVAIAYRNRNREERNRKAGTEGQLAFEVPEARAEASLSIAEDFRSLGEIAEKSAQDVIAKEELYSELRTKGSDWWKLKIACDLWTAAFFMSLHKKDEVFHGEGVPTTGTLRRFLNTSELNPNLLVEVEKTSENQSFFHWAAEFPHVFEHNGFDVVLGNPPWEQMQLDAREFFALSAPDIKEQPNMAARNKAITSLRETKPGLYDEYRNAKYLMDATQQFIHASERFPKTSFGRLNSAPLFAESCQDLINAEGRVGIIIPSGIATDSYTQYFFRDLLDSQSLVSLYEFENDGFFSDIGQGHMVRFCLLTLSGTNGPSPITNFMFRGKRISDLADADRVFSLTINDFRLMNPNTLTCPTFRTSRDADITRTIYKSSSVFLNESGDDVHNPWNFSGLLMFMSNTDSGRFRSQSNLEESRGVLKGNVFSLGEERYLPLYEAKMMHQYNNRHGDYAGIPFGKSTHVLPQPSFQDLSDPDYSVLPRYWISEVEVDNRIGGLWDRDWFIGWRDVTDGRASIRSVIATVLPKVAITEGIHLALCDFATPAHISGFIATLNSLVLDFVARFKIGGLHLSFFVFNQLPIFEPRIFDRICAWDSNYSFGDWMTARVLELTYTSWELKPFAIDLGYAGPPFRFDRDRMFLLRCELDAAFMHLYELTRDDIDYMMEGFDGLKRQDNRDHSEYRTKRVILEVYDEMSKSIETGQPYQTRLNPAAADSSVAHPRKV